jgi:hypothetical protein
MRRIGRLIERHGVMETARMLGVSRETLARIRAELPVRAGSVALARQNIAHCPS